VDFRADRPGRSFDLFVKQEDGGKKTVQVVSLDFFQKINVSGAPFKGPEDAAVVIAVFDDFE
jgi:hypothetical protein